MDVLEFRLRDDHVLKVALKKKLQSILKQRGIKTTLKIIKKWTRGLIKEDPLKEDWYEEIGLFALDFVEDEFEQTSRDRGVLETSRMDADGAGL